ncbi:MAG: hypothetical protein EOO40_03410, partial [Deltaproteobacteria bacterium]
MKICFNSSQSISAPTPYERFGKLPSTPRQTTAEVEPQARAAEPKALGRLDGTTSAPALRRDVVALSSGRKSQPTSETFESTGELPRWSLDIVAEALAKADVSQVSRHLRDAMQRVPYHGLWAAAIHRVPSGALLYGQLGQDIVRSMNGALGQYSTAERLGACLKHAYANTCRSMAKEGVHLTLLAQEYNMVFLRAPQLPTVAQAQRLQEVLNAQVWQQVRHFVTQAKQAYPLRREALAEVEATLLPDVPLINLGVCPHKLAGPQPRAQQVARAAIGASAAAKLARLGSTGFAFAEPGPIMAALAQYRGALDGMRHRSLQGEPLVLEGAGGELLLSPAILALHRAKKLCPELASEISGLVGLLNCLDWVQQSRFGDIPLLAQRARLGRRLKRSVGGARADQQLEAVRTFCRSFVPYLALAEELVGHDGTLFWIDMKKLAVRCHIIREAEAMQLLARQDAGEQLSLEEVVDSIIAIDTRVQDAREVLPSAIELA